MFQQKGSLEEERKGERREMRGRSVWRWIHARRWRSSERQQQRRVLHQGPETLEELLDRHLVKKRNDAEFENRRQLTSTRREALSLYRDILRATRFFTWPDSRGVPWRHVLRDNARTEFEQARFETDPEIVTRLLLGGRQALHSALDKLADKHRHKHLPHQP
ncbi:hypothetical protein VNO78_12881 [Psophocarpus tetragonolobus]|uniref:Complex 1 LYR protein domain-containing protein n=1 Tax=Psophocarpus tetragonolobus TaxID=3891 RepID=A0AAN9SNL2_PSOTE